jgi:hypothetical protein
LAGGAGKGETRNAVMRSTQGDVILVYLSSPAAIAVRMDKITASESVQAAWIDVCTGERVQAGVFPNKGTVSFTPPTGGEDALLFLGR